MRQMRRAVALLLTMGIAILVAAGAGLIPNLESGGISVAEAQTSSGDQTLSGVLNVRWVDPKPESDVEPGVEYVLTDDQGQKTKLDLDEEISEPAGGALALDRKRVRVEGRGIPDDQVDVQSIEPAQNARAEAQRTVTGSKPTVTILCRFSDSTGITPHAKSWFETLMGGTNPGLDNYFREISYGSMNLAGSSVSGWHNMTHPKSYYQVSGGYDEDLMAQDCTDAANASVYFPSYTNINLLFNDNPDSYALGGSNTLSLDGQTKTYGMTWMPRFAYEPGSGVNGTGQVWLAHEMGHAFGLPHSSGPYSDPYDSDWDPMSDGSICSPPHAQYGCVGVYTISYHMDELLGWIPASRKYTATSSPDQNITLERLGNPNSTSDYLMAKIPIAGSSTKFYTVEARRSTGYDAQIPGEAIVIHKVDTSLGANRPARVVDATNNGDPNDAGSMWLPGETFTDSANGISVEVTGETTSGYQVTINPSGGGGDTEPPTVASGVPLPEKTGISRKANVKATFSEVMDTTTLTKYNVTLYKDGSSTPVSSKVTPSTDGMSVTLNPYGGTTKQLARNAWYQVVIWKDPTGVKDADDKLPLVGGGSYRESAAGDYVYWWFKTKSG